MNRIAPMAVLVFMLGSLAGAESAQKKVLIIGIDGCRPDAVAVARTPNLNWLKTNGCFTDLAQTDPHTKSGPAWSSMFCGVWGDKHGVMDNSLSGSQYNSFPNFFVRLEQANSNWNTLAFVRWAPITGITAGADLSQAMGSDAASMSTAVNRLTNANPDVMFVHFLDVDSVGHGSGFSPTNTNYVRQIETVDGQIGSILNALTNRPSYPQEDWLTIVLTDHGGIGLNHGEDTPVERTQFQIYSGPSAGRGGIWPVPSMVDVCATVLAHMGVPISPQWSLDARPTGLSVGPTPLGTNLILNGDAEYTSGTNNYSPNRCVSWWIDVGDMTVGQYGSHSNFPSMASPGPASREANFFLGGVSANSSMSQTIDIPDLASAIDGSGIVYELAGFFGGTGNQNDSALLTARFLDASGTLIATNQVGAVGSAARGGVTGLLERKATAMVPALTRRVEFVLSSSAASGPNDGTADNLSFVLTRLSDPFPILRWNFSSNQWQVAVQSQTNRSYTLERSGDLKTWMDVPSPIAGTGTELLLKDPSPSNSQGFYRVRVAVP